MPPELACQGANPKSDSDMWAKKGVLRTTPKLLVGFCSNLAQLFPRVGGCASQVGMSRGEPKSKGDSDRKCEQKRAF